MWNKRAEIRENYHEILRQDWKIKKNSENRKGYVQVQLWGKVSK